VPVAVPAVPLDVPVAAVPLVPVAPVVVVPVVPVVVVGSDLSAVLSMCALVRTYLSPLLARQPLTEMFAPDLSSLLDAVVADPDCAMSDVLRANAVARQIPADVRVVNV
jgi:hypothetical protein